MTERKRFEQWWKTEGKWFGLSRLDDTSDKAVAWKTWQAARGWIPAEDRLPNWGQLVVAWNGQGFISGYYDGGEEKINMAGYMFEFTHWQLLPSPPEDV